MAPVPVTHRGPEHIARAWDQGHTSRPLKIRSFWERIPVLPVQLPGGTSGHREPGRAARPRRAVPLGARLPEEPGSGASRRRNGRQSPPARAANSRAAAPRTRPPPRPATSPAQQRDERAVTLPGNAHDARPMGRAGKMAAAAGRAFPALPTARRR